MKASLKFQSEDQNPLFRAKVPLNILGFPFQSGLSTTAGDPKNLSLNLSTFFESGPSLKLIYRPNDSFNPFSLVVKTGIGPFGSPISAPLSMSAEFNLLGGGDAYSRGNPSFFLQFRPQFGDYSLKKSSNSAIAILPKIGSGVSDISVDADGKTDTGNRVGAVNLNCLGLTNAVKGVEGFFNDVELSARTVLPIRDRAVLKCRWGVKFPAEFSGSNPTAAISFKKIPFLVMNKISIEHVVEDDRKKENDVAFAGNTDVVETCFGVKRQLEGIQVENGLLRKAMEELRLEMGARDRKGDFGKSKSNGGKYLSGGVGKMTDGEMSEELRKD